MADKRILHLLSPLDHVSPFDVNMALDAGYDAVIPHARVTPDQVVGLVQDAIFSRPPELAIRTGIFFGGRDAVATLDMVDVARRAMVPPFVVSIFADPAGSFTTAAALVAHAERAARTLERDLDGLRVVIFGATGVVGFASGVIAALHGARVTLAGHEGLAHVAAAAAQMGARFGVEVAAGDASDELRKLDLLRAAQIVFCTAKAGTRVLTAEQLRAAPDLLVAADVNAVPPSGVEGIDAHADRALIGAGTLAIGPLAIGGTKYRTELALFRRMIEAEAPVSLDFRDAFDVARALVGP